MKTIIVTDSIIVNNTVLVKGARVAVTDWYPATNLISKVYSISLVSSAPAPDTELLLANIYYSDSQYMKWVGKHVDIEWQTVETDTYSFAVLLGPGNRGKREISDNDISAEGWKYRLVILEPEEEFSGVFEPIDINYTVSWCSDYVDTEGLVRVIGAQCPIDPQTKKPMKSCMNWRRTDAVGVECRKIMTSDELQDAASSNYCSNHIDAEDCRCINRGYSDEYTRNKPLHPEDDYCWYPPCASGYYLVKNRSVLVPCDSKYCQVVYNIQDTGQSVGVSSNKNSLVCFNNPEGTSQSDTRPGEVRPGEVRPPVTKPGEVRPPVTKPGEVKPPVTKPGDVKPPVSKPPERPTDYTQFALVAGVAIILVFLMR